MRADGRTRRAARSRTHPAARGARPLAGTAGDPRRRTPPRSTPPRSRRSSGSRCASPTPTPTATRSTSARCSSRRTRSPGPPTRMTMLLNPNNHALDGGPRHLRDGAGGRRRRSRACSAAPRHLGHLTCGGTIANLEALWVARAAPPRQRRSLVCENAHYTHLRHVAQVLGAAVRRPSPRTTRGRMDVDALERRLAAGGVGTVVATLGTTPSARSTRCTEIAAAVQRVTASASTSTRPTAATSRCAPISRRRARRRSTAHRRSADSIVIDPHKHGLQPYGCGCVLFRDPGVGRFYAHDSPYTYFTSKRAAPRRDQPRVQPRGSRRRGALGDAAGDAAAPGRASASLLADSRAAALELAGELAGSEVALVVEPELDIVCPFPAGVAASRRQRALRAGVLVARAGRLARRKAACADVVAARPSSRRRRRTRRRRRRCASC